MRVLNYATASIAAQIEAVNGALGVVLQLLQRFRCCVAAVGSQRRVRFFVAAVGGYRRFWCCVAAVAGTQVLLEVRGPQRRA